jgi:GDP-D-mannose 3', 5'-epimerase
MNDTVRNEPTSESNADMTGRSVLVTGGAGMIGSHLVRRLVSAGARVRVVDNLWRGTLDNFEGPDGPVIDLRRDFLEGDLRDPEVCRRAVDGCDTVYHLADVVAGINYVFGNQFSLYTTNILIDRNVVEASVEARVSNYIAVGSACSYPAEKQSIRNPPPMREEDAYPASPESAYGWSKLMGEYVAELAQREGLMNVGVVRLHNVYGPRCDMTPQRSQVIPALIRKAINHPDEPFVVWGSGSQRRSFVHVDDAVEAIMRVRARGMNAGPIQCGHEHSTSIAEIAAKIVRLSGKPIEIVFDRSKPEGDVDRYACMDKSRRVLGWTPTIGIDEGLASTYRWAASIREALREAAA